MSKHRSISLSISTLALAFAVPAYATNNVNDPSSYAFANTFGPYVGGGQTSQVQAEIRNGVLGNNYDSTGGSSTTTSHSADNYTNHAQVVSNSGNTAWATSDIANGAVRAFTSNGNGPVARSFAEARITDTVFFSNNSGTTLYLPFSFSFDGRITDTSTFSSTASAIFNISGASTACADGSYGTCYGDHSMYLQNGGNANSTTVIGYASNGTYNGVQQGGAFFFNAPDNVDLANWTVSKNWNSGGGYYDTVVSSVLAIQSGDSRLGFDLRLKMDCTLQGTICDFGNTSKFAFGTLPTGLGFTSASGVFLQGNQSGAVPEPASWGMMIIGFGLIGTAMRRRTRLVTGLAAQ
ncbi:MAG: PEPxxWA-CTERM sorting domain-containing protein [Sphingomonadales bacterium]